MPFFDILKLALRNLREAKLRAALTIIGVTVGVAVIVTMVSFGLGLQRNTIERFKQLDLFNEITVNGRNLNALVETALNSGRNRRFGNGRAANNGAANDSQPAFLRSSERALDDAAIAEIAKLPGVISVEPSISFPAYVRANHRVALRQIGGAVVPNFSSRFKNFAAGGMLSSNDAREAVITEELARDVGFEKPEDAVGQTLELLAPPKRDARQTVERQRSGAKSKDDAMSFFGLPLGDDEANANSGEKSANGDEKKGETDEGANNDAFKNVTSDAAHTFRIVGVSKSEANAGGLRALTGIAAVYLPLAAAREMSKDYRSPLSEVALNLARAQGVIGGNETAGYGAAIVRVSDPSLLSDVRKRLTEMKFASFSIVDQLEQIKTFFLVINSALGLLGGISLLVASFGIANTMIMSILERTREIGIMKAIGAEDREIKLIFFVEAAVIGFIGGGAGVLIGWAIDGAANRLAYRFLLKPQGASFVDFFALPPYLWLGAILFAIIVAIIAALYPASRAAAVDPVKALRHD
jgi:ABC-type antimicrobial peptide transport system permease subunit